jgi:YidC/Oxa1 family membrane protein insertase
MFASIFQVLIVKPIFNLLVFIYAIIPGHNFGLALVIFTIVVRLLMWPLVKKQLHQAKAMRQLQPEIKKIKAQTKGNRQLESQMLMELYKEREISPFGSIGTLLIQFVILIGLYSGLRDVIAHPDALFKNAYHFIANMSWIKELAHNIHLFDPTLLGFINLAKPALGKSGIYWPAMIIVIASAITQYFASKQLLPDQKDSRGLKNILKDAGTGKKADQSEINAAVGKTTRYFIPLMIFLFTVNIPSALSLYWLVGGLIAFLQQGYVLRKDETEMEVIADKPDKKPKTSRTVIESEVITKPIDDNTKTVNVKKKPAKKSTKNKRRKK